MKKAKIQVRIGREASWRPGQVLGTIDRVLRAKQIGNFNPVFCIYHYKKHLIRSAEGDLSDPFRRDESYIDSLYIEL